MHTYHFTLLLSTGPRDLVEWSNSLYEAGGDDSHPGIDQRGAYATFDRQAETLEEAIRSALATIQAAGLVAARLEIESDELQSLTA